MKNVKRNFMAVFVALFLAIVPLGTLMVSTQAGATPQSELCKGSGGVWSGEDCTYSRDKGVTNINTLVENIVNILLFIIGAVAVIMIIIGGIRYTTSNGDQAQVTSAKNTILYAVIGMVVAMLAYAIVRFIVRSL